METVLVGMEAAKAISAAFPAAPPIPFLRLKSQSSTFPRISPNFLSLTSPLPRRTLRPLSCLLSVAADSSPRYKIEEGEEFLEEDLENLRHKTLIVENIHRTRKLKNLLRNLSGGAAATAAAMNGDELWIAANFLIQNNRHGDALHLFDEWRLISPSRSSPSNFSRMALLFSSHLAIPQTFSLLSSMADLDLPVPLSLYNSLLSALAKTNQFDEMGKLMKKMKLSGSNPNSATFNLLIAEFAKAGLLKKMESAHRSILSMKMSLLPSSITAMVEAYADVSDIPKMEKMYRRLLSSSSRSRHAMVKAYTEDGEVPNMEKMYQRSLSSLSSRCGFSEDLIRMMAMVYIKNLMFSRLEDLGNDLAAKTGRTNSVWLLLLLASALILSRRGMDSILKEMRSSMVDDDISFINIMAMAHAKMKGFRDLEALFMKLGENGDLSPDLATVGVFFDACSCGFDGGRVLDVWKRKGFLERKVEMATDSLVIAGFGKGRFVKSCEELFILHGDHDDDRDGGIRKEESTYADLIRQLFLSGKLIG